MPNKDWRKGENIMLVVMAVVTLLVGLSVFVFNTDLKLFMKRATLTANIIGGLCFIASWVWLLIGSIKMWEAKAAIGWILFLLAGFVVSCGFNFDYFGL